MIEKLPPGSTESQPEEWYLSGPEAYARGSYSTEGFVVREASYCRLKVVDSAKESFVTTGRERLVANGILVEEGGHLVFKEDYQFKSPSGAAMVVLGRTANGWMEWKNKSGVVIDQLRKKAVAEAAAENGGTTV
ncbi:DUF4357 domain-containing protein [Luteolibacter sp. Populi]|uniref:DUF4357 domain-containing protein n=1 Tax=Luteolibacter sp. Populi TaxID=3230487 RepID=UPI0034678D45